MAEWQKIETAPTDGCLIVLAGRNECHLPHGIQVEVGRWHGGGWRVFGPCQFSMSYPPTLWQPLPAF